MFTLTYFGFYLVAFGGSFASFLALLQNPVSRNLDMVFGGFLITQVIFICLVSYKIIKGWLTKLNLIIKLTVLIASLCTIFFVSLFLVYLQAVAITTFAPFVISILYCFVPFGALGFAIIPIFDVMLMRKVQLMETGEISPESLNELSAVIDYCVRHEDWSRADSLSKKLLHLAENGCKY